MRPSTLSRGISIGVLHLVPFGLAVVFLAVVGAYIHLGEEAYRAIVRQVIVLPWRFPFFDTHAVLAAVECHAKGWDVFVDNPCDVLERPFIYAPQWLWLSWFSLDDRHTLLTGTLFGLGAIATLAYLNRAAVDASGRVALAVQLGTMLSPTVTFALERGNIDLLVFMFAVAIARLLTGSPGQRLAAYAIAVIGALLKFYPIILIALASRETLRRALPVAVASALVVLGFTALYWHSVLKAFANIPHLDWSNVTFGASVMPLGLTRLAPRWTMVPLITRIVLLLATLFVVVAMNRGRFLETRLARLTPLQLSALTVGSFLLAGCFFAGQSFAYRALFLLLLVPACVRLASDSVAVKLITALVFLLLWQWYLPIPIGTAAPALELIVLWAFLQFAWWALIALCLGLAVHVVLRSRAIAEVLTLLPRLPRTNAR